MNQNPHLQYEQSKNFYLVLICGKFQFVFCRNLSDFNLNPNIHISDLEIDNNSTYFHQMHMMMLNMSDAQPVVGQKDEAHFKGIDTQPIKGN